MVEQNDSKPRHEEHQYLDLVNECIKHGNYRTDRTGTGAYSLFGKQMRFSLTDGIFPLLTTKFVPFRVVLAELLFFVRGETDNAILREQKVHIWDGNSTREFFLKNGIDREKGDLGPVYGFQWRHWNAEYSTCKTNYTDKGIDQLHGIIQRIRENPADRRLVVSAWNPEQIPIMALPPCHCLFQFHISEGRLNCMLYQRSGDMGLGIPFNIASYSLLTIMIAKLTGLEPGEFVHTIGDTHVYADHVEPLKIQLQRRPRPFPKLRLKEKEYRELEDFQVDDFILEGYDPDEKIYMKMSV